MFFPRNLGWRRFCSLRTEIETWPSDKDVTNGKNLDVVVVLCDLRPVDRQHSNARLVDAACYGTGLRCSVQGGGRFDHSYVALSQLRDEALAFSVHAAVIIRR